MIYLRLDERLMHGQVTSTWVGFYGITHIIIANDDVLQNDVQVKLIKMTAPKGVKVLISDIDKALNILNDKRCDTLKILVICSKLEDVLKLIDGSENVKDVNLANYGFLSNPNAKNKKMLTSNLSVDEEECKIVSEIMSRDIDCYCQVISSQARKPIKL